MANWTFRDTILGADVVVDDSTTALGPYFGNGRYHVKVQPPGTIPATTAIAGANNGTSPPAPVVTAGDNDIRGNITFGSGSTPAAGAQVVVTYGRTWPTSAVVGFTPKNSVTQALGLYVSSSSATGFTLSSANAPTASQANTVYAFDYDTTP